MFDIQNPNNNGYSTGINEHMVSYTYQIFSRFFKDYSNVLELGPAEGIMTNYLVQDFSEVTTIDANIRLCKDLKKRFPNVEVINDYFLDAINYKIKNKYSNIILGHVLEHVYEADLLLERCINILKSNGLIFTAVPNCNSLHRQLGVELGLLKTTKELNKADIAHGHVTVYSLDELKYLFKKTGLQILHYGGYWLKTLSNEQIDFLNNEKLLYANMKLGEKYPEIAAENYIIGYIDD